MNLMPDLFSFAYVPGWYAQLEELAELAIPEPWRFRSPNYFTKNQDTPILERYIHSIFRKQAISTAWTMRNGAPMRMRDTPCSMNPVRRCTPPRRDLHPIW